MILAPSQKANRPTYASACAPKAKVIAGPSPQAQGLNQEDCFRRSHNAASDVYTVNVRCDNPEHLKYIGKALERCIDVGFDLSGLKILASKETDYLLYNASDYGGYRPELKAIVFRHNVDWHAAVKEARTRFPEWIEKTYSGNPSHLALHEIGHYLHHQTAPEMFAQNSATKLDDRTKKMILQEMGHKYPTKNVGEFVAEMFAGLMGGKRYSPQLLKLYQEYNGPIPPALKV